MRSVSYDDIDDLLRKAQERKVSTDSKTAGRDLSAAWERIQQAHDHTTAATQVREAGLEREFYLIALADLADVRDAAEEQVKALTRYLVNEHNVATVTVAQQAGVAQSTASRWANTE